MRRTLIVMALLTTLAGYHGLGTPPLTLAGPADLAAAVGGACENCAPDTSVSCTGTLCYDPGPAYPFWVLRVGNLITVMKCAPAATGVGGFDKCTLGANMACYNYSTCTLLVNGQCSCCSPAIAPAGNDKPTSCSTSGGYRCTGT